MNEQVTITRATTPGEIAAAIAIREDMYSDYLGLSPRSWSDEHFRDDDGYLFVLRDAGVDVGSGRVLPISSKHVELRAFRRIPVWAERDRKMCEISRIAARPRLEGIPYGWLGLFLGAQWLLGHTDLQRYIAYARQDLVPLYENVGAHEVGIKFQIPARGSSVYAVLTGSLEHTVKRGTSLLGALDACPATPAAPAPTEEAARVA